MQRSTTHTTHRTHTTHTTRRRTKRTKTVIATALTGVAALGMFATAQAAHASVGSAAGAGAEAGHAAHAADFARTSATPYVINHYGEENADKGRAERSPKHLVLSEFTSIHGLRWKEWGAKKAVATGKVTGTWCLDTCLDKPLKATVTLSDPKTVNGRKVFSTFTLKLAKGTGAYDSEDLRGSSRPLATS
ncbi:hypothetical protein [Streptomyces sp. S186]|uniref:hypothetical protein n=1 Tax=Streptomyces sp. S186 TaxID=3434395 RepID=UPI003F669CCC